jgi:hypothetical protein
VPDSDVGGKAREARKIFSNRIVEIELALLDQHQHGSRRELLADRSQAEIRRRLDAHVIRDVGPAIATHQHGLAVPDHHHGGPGCIVCAVIGKQAVHFACIVGRATRQKQNQD